jgi:hypothetical protein
MFCLASDATRLTMPRNGEAEEAHAVMVGASERRLDQLQYTAGCLSELGCGKVYQPP